MIGPQDTTGIRRQHRQWGRVNHCAHIIRITHLKVIW
jgi:hypothetical protein